MKKDILEEIIKEGKLNSPDFNVDLVRRAFEFARRIHEGQFRKSGDPYIIHPLSVAKILTEWKADDVTITAALLHDVLEDTNAPYGELYEELTRNFSGEIANIIHSVSKLDRNGFSSAVERQVENFRRMIPAMLKDLRVILIKLADRTHNMRTLSFLPEEKQLLVAQETMDIYS